MNNSTFTAIKKDIKAWRDPQRAVVSQRFFKTGPGEYGEGDVFWGLSMPKQRQIARKFYHHTPLPVVDKLLNDSIHEVRMVGLLILTYQYPKKSEAEQRQMYDFYLAHTQQINNWDLVDVTAPKIIGQFLLNHPQERVNLTNLAGSSLLWERRIAVLSCFPLIKVGQFEEILEISRQLIKDDADLMHKAVGWMLREVGKVDAATLKNFLDEWATQMPRTMLRYAIEKMSDPVRRHYLILKN